VASLHLLILKRGQNDLQTGLDPGSRVRLADVLQRQAASLDAELHEPDGVREKEAFARERKLVA
jgi:hypothetical protein